MPDDDPNGWWREGVLYQIYPRSFADTDGDGVGNIAGITAHLDHLAWLGVRGVWLCPVTVSRDTDWGYDVADYTDVQPVLGSLSELDELIASAAERDIRVILDLVPNHTSDCHPWFVESRASRDNAKRDWYVWVDPKPDGSPPNNWTSSFGGPAWTLDEATGQYYLHNFLREQPDLNWWNDDVRAEFDRILRFWFDRGVAGFRIDVAHMIVKDRLLRDNPPTTDDDHWFVRVQGQRPTYNSCQPEVHDVMRRWRAIADEYDPPRVLIGETHVFDYQVLASFYGEGDELDLAFNFMFINAPLESGELRTVVEATNAALSAGSWPVWTGGNHDNYRFPTRWAGGNPDATRAALMMLLTLRGTPFLYYGDEIGMPDTDVPRERILDPVGIRFFPVYGRDPERTPMHWSSQPGAGFTETGVEPWLPFGDYAVSNVAEQRHDPDSTLALTRDLISLRDAMPELRRGAYTPVEADAPVWAWRRGERALVALNLSHTAATVPDVRGTVRIGTRRTRDNERIDGKLPLDPWDGVVVWLDEPQ
jgi:alpha-glucosidase